MKTEFPIMSGSKVFYLEGDQVRSGYAIRMAWFPAESERAFLVVNNKTDDPKTGVWIDTKQLV